MKLPKANLVFAFLFSYIRDAPFYCVVLGGENNHQKRRSYPNRPLYRCVRVLSKQGINDEYKVGLAS